MKNQSVARSRGGPNPAACRHRTFRRVGIQRAPIRPYRLYLLTCKDCGTTLTTQTVRSCRESAPAALAPSPLTDDDLAAARQRRMVG